ncbi:MAG: indole-3-glycerol phosphate synthase TrpC [Anaerolineaceae bacterium]|nr:indole-3-glycerol phosphate synthase TrpC [Anaerolineaceae bacterium]
MNDLPDILAEILRHKRGELADRKAALSLAEVRARAGDRPPARDMAAALTREPGGAVRVIAEIKRRSPSAGEICSDFNPRTIAAGYAEAGVDAVSVLTDEKYFGGRLEYLDEVRSAGGLPVLRKDFLLEAYQVWEARAWGGDSFLLIADALAAGELAELVSLGRELGMEPLVESHDQRALERAVASGAKLLGVNNRDLRTFSVDLQTTVRLAGQVPDDRLLVAESGIRTAGDVGRLLAAGVQAILVGQSLMRAKNRAELVGQFKSAR